LVNNLNEIVIDTHVHLVLCCNTSAVEMVYTRYRNKTGQNLKLYISETPFVYGIPAGGTLDCITDQLGRFVLYLRSVRAARHEAAVWDGLCSHVYDYNMYSCTKINRVHTAGITSPGVIHRENGIGVGADGNLLIQQTSRMRCHAGKYIMAANEETALTYDRRIDFLRILHFPSVPKEGEMMVDLQSSHDGTLAMGARGSVFFSPDFGNTWQMLREEGATAIALSRENSTAAVAGSDGVITLYEYDREERHELIEKMTIQGTLISQLALSSAFGHSILVWLAADGNHGVVSIEFDRKKYRSICSTFVHEAYDCCVKEDELDVDSLVDLVDRMTGGRSGRNVVRMIRRGQRNYKMAREFPDQYIHWKDFESIFVSFADRKRFIKTFGYSLAWIYVWLRVFFLNLQRRKALRDLCCLLCVRAGVEGSLRIYAMGVNRLVNEAARNLAACVRQEIRRDPLVFSNFPFLFEEDSTGRDLNSVCWAAATYIRRRFMSAIGSMSLTDAYDDGLIHTFILDAAHICLHEEDGKDKDDQLLLCCRAFLLANTAEMKKEKRKRHLFRQSWAGCSRLLNAVNCAANMIGYPALAFALARNGRDK